MLGCAPTDGTPRAVTIARSLGCATLAIALAMLGQLVTVPASAAASLTWTTAGDMRVSRAFAGLVELPDGKVLVTGGFVVNSVPAVVTDTAELFDPATATWSDTGPMAQARYKASVVGMADGRVLAAGGYDAQGNMLSSAEIYDPVTGAWSPAESLPRPQAESAVEEHPGVLLPDGRVVAPGAAQARSDLSVAIYDPATGHWSLSAPILPARQDFTTSLLTDGRLLLASGTDVVPGLYTASRRNDVYDPVNDTWSSATVDAQARMAFATTHMADGQILRTGGVVPVNSGPSVESAQTEIFDETTQTWTTSGDLGTARHYASAALRADGTVLVAGGGDASHQVLASTELYDPETGTWSAGPDMPTRRISGMSVTLADGSTLVTGGYNDSYQIVRSTVLLPAAATTPTDPTDPTGPGDTGGGGNGIDGERVEQFLALPAHQSATRTVSCAPGFLLTDATPVVQHVDQGESYADVRVEQALRVGESAMSFRVANSTGGQAQLKLMAHCVAIGTSAGGDLDVVATPETTVDADGSATVTCPAGSRGLAPSYDTAGGRVATAIPADGTGQSWRFAVEGGDGTATVGLSCLSDHTSAGQLVFATQTRSFGTGATPESSTASLDSRWSVVAVGWSTTSGATWLGHEPQDRQDVAWAVDGVATTTILALRDTLELAPVVPTGPSQPAASAAPVATIAVGDLRVTKAGRVAALLFRSPAAFRGKAVLRVRVHGTDKRVDSLPVATGAGARLVLRFAVPKRLRAAVARPRNRLTLVANGQTVVIARR